MRPRYKFYANQFNSSQKVTPFPQSSSNNNQERKGKETNFEMKDFNAKKQNLVSSRESTSTKDVGTTVDETTIQVLCKSVQFKSKSNPFPPVQFKQQPREQGGGDKC
jgi:hypothetical protein